MPDAAWLVRAGNDNELVDTFVEAGLVAIGWPIGDVSMATSRDDVKRAYRETYPDHNSRRVGVNAGQVYRFAHEVDVGDPILTYDKTDREYHVGEITGEYAYDPDDAPDDYPHVRRVEWNERISRDAFPTPVKNTLGSTLTVFSVADRWTTIRAVLEGTYEETQEEETEETEPPYIDEVEAQADELISDIIANMDPFDFEELVAAVLRAMGYEAETTRERHDYGVDVVAHPDALGFEEPYLNVQVKRQQGTVGGPAMREFTGTLGPHEKGLYVATGGYTRDARSVAREARRRITLLDRDEFIDLLIEHYDELDPEYKTLVPLRPVYLPAQDPPLQE